MEPAKNRDSKGEANMSENNTDSGQAATTYQNAGRIFKSFFEEIGNVIVGQNRVIEEIII